MCTVADIQYIYGNVPYNVTSDLGDEQLYRLYEVWTAKEAYFKCIGTGITNLKSISIEKLAKIKRTYRIDDYIITIVEKDN